MQTYKAPDNSLHCIEPEFAYLLPSGSVEITDAEADAIRTKQQTALSTPEPVDPVIKLKNFLAANPDVAALLGS